MTTKARRHAGRAIRRQRRRREWIRAVAARCGVALLEWQIDVMLAAVKRRTTSTTAQWVIGPRGYMVHREAQKGGRGL